MTEPLLWEIIDLTRCNDECFDEECVKLVYLASNTQLPHASERITPALARLILRAIAKGKGRIPTDIVWDAAVSLQAQIEGKSKDTLMHTFLKLQPTYIIKAALQQEEDLAHRANIINKFRLGEMCKAQSFVKLFENVQVTTESVAGVEATKVPDSVAIKEHANYVITNQPNVLLLNGIIAGSLADVEIIKEMCSKCTLVHIVNLRENNFIVACDEIFDMLEHIYNNIRSRGGIILVESCPIEDEIVLLAMHYAKAIDIFSGLILFPQSWLDTRCYLSLFEQLLDAALPRGDCKSLLDQDIAETIVSTIVHTHANFYAAIRAADIETLDKLNIGDLLLEF